MIDARELNFGNAVMRKTGEDLSPYIIRIGDLDFFDNYFPIPITAEWLQKLGFTSTGSGDDNHGDPLWRHPLTDYFYCESGCMVHNGRAYDDWHDIGEVEYVHQLQNLFFWVTRKELTIK